MAYVISDNLTANKYFISNVSISHIDFKKPPTYCLTG